MCCCRSVECRGVIRFATDLLMTPEQCVHIGWDAELVSCLLELIDRLRDVHVDVVEFAVLNAIVLLYPGLFCLLNDLEVYEAPNTRVTS